MRPHFGHIEYIPSVILCLRGIHDLHVDFPHGKITTLDGLEEILNQEVGIIACDFVRFLPGHSFHPEGCEDMDLDILE